MIRLARPDDLPALIDVERAAGELFRDVGMAAIADDDPGSVAALAAYQAGGRAWVSVDADGRPVAYLVAEVVDGCAHIEQVSVRPSHARRGIGSALIDTLAEWARARGLPALTLTTFETVPWNAPYYERLRFRVVPEAEIGAGLRSIRRAEAARGLDAWPRVAMIRPL
ncbi:Acetyltransferase (GNAT) family protein [Amycolatopsis tolypomycina]|uniref:Acetyltransferase (GNAT) family protein n=1 Tax=Amycolatopsis tolypomycina TaxID=208445 RepID=A0A1H5BGV8_9PSEU|nr:GNAT family N-acetyltransferase [Amycolatopsis tolypomycina]SED53567.1 Acetyltransferase (GNAT) family protein [Amycolatopsis tolypomycina]